MSTKTAILQKLNLYRKNPELFKDLSNAELAQLVIDLMGAVKIIDDAIKQGRLDGYSPRADKDYISLETQKKILEKALKDFSKEATIRFKDKAVALEKKVDEVLSKVENGKDAVVTDAEIGRAAELALELLELPDFDALVDERITANPMAIRDSLETIQEEKEKLDQSAIQNLKEDLLQLQEQIARVNTEVKGGVGTSRNMIDNIILQRIADGTISASSLSFETPSGTINGSNDTFTVSNEPKYVVVNTLTYFAGAGYEYSGGTITFDIPPATGSIIKSAY